MKIQVDRRQKSKRIEKGNKIMLSEKDLVFKERLVEKLVECYIGPYIVKEVISRNVIKLKLLASTRIYPVMNIS